MSKIDKDKMDALAAAYRRGVEEIVRHDRLMKKFAGVGGLRRSPAVHKFNSTDEMLAAAYKAFRDSQPFRDKLLKPRG
jgi:hypothetical protein